MQPTRLLRPWDSPGKNTGVGCHFLLQCMKVKSESEVSRSCPTRSDPMDCSPPGSSVHGILQVTVLEWGAIASPPYGASGKEPTCQHRRHKGHGYDPWVRKIPWRRQWQPTPICLSGQSHRQWRLAATVHGVTKSQTRLKQLSMHTPTDLLLNTIQFHRKE